VSEADDALRDMVTWVNDHASDPEIGLVLRRLGERGLTMDQLAEQDPDEAFELCDALFSMVEDTYSDEMLHSYLKRNQPTRRYDPELVIRDV
jgi:hypothetical protein